MLNYLPLLAERFARQRLRALAEVEGKHDIGVPVVLFLCTHNAGRSQMALGFFNHLAGDRAIAWSGGSEPVSMINPSAVTAMRDRGIDISAEYSKPWTDEVVRAADVVVTMGCGGPRFCVARARHSRRRHTGSLKLRAVKNMEDALSNPHQKSSGRMWSSSRRSQVQALRAVFCCLGS